MCMATSTDKMQSNVFFHTERKIHNNSLTEKITSVCQ